MVGCRLLKAWIYSEVEDQSLANAVRCPPYDRQRGRQKTRKLQTQLVTEVVALAGKRSVTISGGVPATAIAMC